MDKFFIFLATLIASMPITSKRALFMTKKHLFIPLFAAYYLFMPFILVNCGKEDTPFVANQEEPQQSVEQCNPDDFLIESCVEHAISEQEKKDKAKQKPTTTTTTLPGATTTTSTTLAPTPAALIDAEPENSN